MESPGRGASSGRPEGPTGTRPDTGGNRSQFPGR
jgi:hypothetical protein